LILAASAPDVAAADLAQGRAAFDEGRRLIQAGDHRAALAQFKKGYLSTEDASFLLNIAPGLRSRPSARGWLWSPRPEPLGSFPPAPISVVAPAELDVQRLPEAPPNPSANPSTMRHLRQAGLVCASAGPITDSTFPASGILIPGENRACSSAV